MKDRRTGERRKAGRPKGSFKPLVDRRSVVLKTRVTAALAAALKQAAYRDGYSVSGALYGLCSGYSIGLIQPSCKSSTGIS